MLKNKDIYGLHTLLKNKKVSSTELTQDALSNLKKTQDNAYITVTEEIALEQASKADKLLAENHCHSYLHGIPYSLKDLFVTENIRTTAGSRYLMNYIPPYQGQVAHLLKKSHAVLVGKVGCDEFGMGSTNKNTPFGHVNNPVNADYTAGGSSGGSAAAVGNGSCAFSIGTDTGGSIRLPANFCGLSALKPTYGRISRYGQIAYGSSLDQASPIAKTVMDLACIMEELTHPDNRDASQVPLKPMKVVEELEKISASWLNGKTIGIDYSFLEQCNPLVKKSLEEALKKFSKQGVKLKEISLPNLKYSVAVYYLIATSEASANLARYDGLHFGHQTKVENPTLEQTYTHSRSEGLGAEVKKRIMLGTFALSSGFSDQFFIKAAKVRRIIANDFKQAFANCDFIFSPVCVSTAFSKKSFEQFEQDALKEYMNDLYTIPVNLAGLPALALPSGQAENSMPTGFQLIGKQFADEDLLRAGVLWQKQ
jgi:aspartyl-tRNA(Asn)/glutamyl-tRNA(Gln) amidotransferase subunit A